MKVLVIPDVHLKPWMFDRASEAYNRENCDIAVCLGDIPDDFGQQHNVGLYEDTFNRAIQFHKDHPNTLWCLGNHEVSYITKFPESGYSLVAETAVVAKINELSTVVGNNLKIVHKIDSVVFSHAGLQRDFVLKCVKSESAARNVQTVVNSINTCPVIKLWEDCSPIWFRPQIYTAVKTYSSRKLLQVVGHTPVKQINVDRNILSCDSFSTHRDGTPYGTQEFTVVDTTSWKWYTTC